MKIENNRLRKKRLQSLNLNNLIFKETSTSGLKNRTKLIKIDTKKEIEKKIKN